MNVFHDCLVVIESLDFQQQAHDHFAHAVALLIGSIESHQRFNGQFRVD